MGKHTYKDFKEAMNNYIDSEHPLESADFYEIRREIEDIIKLSKLFENNYGFRLNDWEIYLIWGWNSNAKDTIWLATSYSDKHLIDVFEHFVERWSDSRKDG